MPFNIGAPELIILLVLALIIFGPGKLPEVGQALGRTVREFRSAADSVNVSTEPKPATPAVEPAAKTESESAKS